MERNPAYRKLPESQKCMFSLGDLGLASYNPSIAFIPWHFVAPATLNPSLCTAIESLDFLLIFDLLI